MNVIERKSFWVAGQGSKLRLYVDIHAPWLVPMVLGALLMLLLTWRVTALHAGAVADAKGTVHAAQRALLSEAKEALVGRLSWPVRDVKYLATQQTLQRYVANTNQQSRLSDLNDSLFSWMATRQAIYSQARYLDSRGQEVVRVDNRGSGTLMIGGADLQSKSSRYYFQAARGLPEGKVYISPFDLNVENGQVEVPYQPTLRFTAPVFGADRKPQGVVAINFLGQSLIDRLKAAGLRSEQPLWLLNAKSHWMLSTQAEDEWGFMFADKSSVMASESHPALWRWVSGHAPGQYRQTQLAGGLLAALSVDPVEELAQETGFEIEGNADRWHLVSWVPKADLDAQLAPLARQYTWYFVGWAALVLSLCAAGWYLLQRRAQADAALRHANKQLLSSNQELETFSYTVSHDLRSPLRAIDGYSRILLQSSANQLDDASKDYLQRMRAASQRMGSMIDDILALSRISRKEVERRSVDLSALATQITTQIREADPQRQVTVQIAPNLQVMADERLLRIALDNLLRNAWKFTSKSESACIEVGCDRSARVPVFYVRDNGAGFDMTYADKLFGAFQRLHQASEFPGSGIGLATVQRVIHKHGGRIWANGTVGAGASFHFTFSP